MRLTSLLGSALLLAATSSAWPWPSRWQPFAPAVKRDYEPLEARATSFDLSFSATQGNTATTISTEESATQTGNSGGSNGTAKSTKTSASKSGPTEFDPRLPAGGLTMVTPNPIAGAVYYKIKDQITFGWNYTSLSITPSAVDILASCALNQATYTLALNQSITGPTQAFTWDTGEFQASATQQLLTETYTLIIHDAAKDVTDTAQAGYLATYEQFTFGMYVPQPYTPIADWVCATCSGAMSLGEKQTMGFMLGMATVTVLSFTWFSGVAGLW